jgi:hypothetical protein
LFHTTLVSAVYSFSSSIVLTLHLFYYVQEPYTCAVPQAQNRISQKPDTSSVVFETAFHYVCQADAELSIQSRLALSLSSAGIISLCTMPSL